MRPGAWFAQDSPLEGDGFEPSVPHQIRSPFRDSRPVSHAGENGFGLPVPNASHETVKPSDVETTGSETTLLRVEGNFNVTGPLETFANAGGVHLARAILAEFAENVAKLVAEPAHAASPRLNPAAEDRQKAAPRQDDEQLAAPAASELKGGKILWRAFVSWLRQVFFGKRDAQFLPVARA